VTPRPGAETSFIELWRDAHPAISCGNRETASAAPDGTASPRPRASGKETKRTVCQDGRGPQYFPKRSPSIVAPGAPLTKR